MGGRIIHIIHVNSCSRTPLILAVRSENPEMVQKLLSFKMIDPELKDNSDKSALDYADYLHSKELVVKSLSCMIHVQLLTNHDYLLSQCHVIIQI